MLNHRATQTERVRGKSRFPQTPMSQNCHARESGNPWSNIAAQKTILVRTKTRRQGATSLCVRAFVRTILPTDGIGRSLRWGDGHIRLRPPIPQHCHSRESGNPWSYISARDTFLVRTKTRRQGATSLCLRAFVRTILAIVRPIDSRFRGNDKSKGSRRGAKAAEGHSPQCHAGAEGVQSKTRFSIHRATQTEG